MSLIEKENDLLQDSPTPRTTLSIFLKHGKFVHRGPAAMVGLLATN